MTAEQIAVVMELGKWLAGGGLALLLTFLLNRFKARTERQAAVTHGGAELVDASTNLVRELIARIESLERWRDESELEKAAQASRITLLETVIAMWNTFWIDLEARWSYHRQQESPPPHPVAPNIKEASA